MGKINITNQVSTDSMNIYSADLSDYPTGIYFVNIISDYDIIKAKIVKN